MFDLFSVIERLERNLDSSSTDDSLESPSTFKHIRIESPDDLHKPDKRLHAKGSRSSSDVETDHEGPSPICRAAQDGRLEIVRFLLENETSAKYSTGFEIPLHCAESEGHTQIVKLLLNYGADVTEMEEEGETPLLLASAAGHLEVVRMLVQAGADPLFHPYFGDLDDAVEIAKTNGHNEVVAFFEEASQSGQ